MTLLDSQRAAFESWMTEALDFYGNPRRRGGHVDIGLHQSPSASTFMRVR